MDAKDSTVTQKDTDNFFKMSENLPETKSVQPGKRMYGLVGFVENPFRISVDPEYFASVPEHNHALEALVMSINECAGLNVVYGDYGTGKSTLAAVLSSRFSNHENCRLVNVGSIPGRSPRDLYFRILVAAGENPDDNQSETEVRVQLEDLAAKLAVLENKFMLVFIDEAQTLSLACLDVLRTLVNFELKDRKVFHFVLFGQLPLLTHIRRRKNLADRINLSVVLDALSVNSLKSLIKRRIEIASEDKENVPNLFEPEALDLIYRYSKGYPRRALILCDHVLKDFLVRNEGGKINAIAVCRVAGALVKLYGQR